MTATTGSSQSAAPLLEVRGVSKQFPGVRALDEVDLVLARGEVLAVVGENGAGKSTLMKILGGVHTPDAGRILLDGRPVTIDSVITAMQLGVSLIHQELNLADNLDVAGNVLLGREPHVAGPIRWVPRRQLEAAALPWMRRVGLDVSPRTLVRDLPIGQQQLVEIAKALSTDARILIMDEPTSSLSGRETELLFETISQLCRQGVSIIYISHRLGEVRQVADRVTVLRDGRNAGDLTRDEITHDAMVRLMVGRALSTASQRTSHARDDVVLRVNGVRTPAHPDHAISFTLRAGEIVGLAGLVGAGRSELAATLFGVTPPLAGTVEVAGKTLAINTPHDAISAGIALVPEDRKQYGLIVEMTVSENLSLAGLRTQSRRGLIDRAAERALADRMIQHLGIRTPHRDQIMQYLSGGNQQKTVLGKWLAVEPRVLILDEPTRGIDVGAKAEIYQHMDALAAKGVAILMISSEMEEVVTMSDRVLVMHEGRLAGELHRDQLGEEAIMQLATGAAA